MLKLTVATTAVVLAVDISAMAEARRLIQATGLRNERR